VCAGNVLRSAGETACGPACRFLPLGGQAADAEETGGPGREVKEGGRGGVCARRVVDSPEPGVRGVCVCRVRCDIP
jgi:hypothetical protein